MAQLLRRLCILRIASVPGTREYADSFYRVDHARMYAVICRTASADIPGNRSLLPQPLNESFLIQLLKETVVDELLGGQFRDPRIGFRHLLHHGLECLRRRPRDPRNVLQNIQIVEVIKDRRIAATEILLHHLNTESALGLAMVHPFNKTTDKLAYGIFLTFDKRTGGDDRRGRKIKSHLGDIGQLPEALLTRDNRQLRINHCSIERAGPERVQKIRHTTELQHG